MATTNPAVVDTSLGEVVPSPFIPVSGAGPDSFFLPFWQDGATVIPAGLANPLLMLADAGQLPSVASGAKWTNLARPGEATTLMNGATRKGRVGRMAAVELDGVSQHITLPAGLFSNMAAGTIAILCDPDHTATTKRLVSDLTGSVGLDIEFRSVSGELQLAVDGVTLVATATSPVTTGWHLYSASWSAGPTAIYVDGKLLTTGGDDVVNAGTHAGTPAVGRSDTNYAAMSVAFVGVWGRALGDVGHRRLFEMFGI